jgi:hypothetical protein
MIAETRHFAIAIIAACYKKKAAEIIVSAAHGLKFQDSPGSLRRSSDI